MVKKRHHIPFEIIGPGILSVKSSDLIKNPRIREQMRLAGEIFNRTKKERVMSDDNCADCGGFDVEWMHVCKKHGTQYCRGCECPFCAEEEAWGIDDYYDELDQNDNPK